MAYKDKRSNLKTERTFDEDKPALLDGVLWSSKHAESSAEQLRGSMQLLPEYLYKWAISNEALPTISDIALPNIYPILGSILGVSDYEYNSVRFWIIDILGEAIRIAQDELKLSMRSQKLMVAWFINTLRSIKAHNWTREEAFSQIRTTVVTAEECLEHTSLGVPRHSASEIWKREDSSISKRFELSRLMSTACIESIEMYAITGLLCHIFVNPFQYEVIKKVFCDMPPIQDLKISYNINHPKLYKHPPSPETKKKVKAPKNKKKELVKEQDELSEQEKAEKERNLYILPLQEAVNQDYFNKLFNIQPEPKQDKKKEKKEKKKAAK